MCYCGAKRSFTNSLESGPVSSPHDRLPERAKSRHAQLRVYGVKKLRIADGSIMPTITTGNTHAPCVIIGERLAEILNA